MAHHSPVTSGVPLNNVSEPFPFDYIAAHLSGVHMAAIPPLDSFQTFNTPSVVGSVSVVKLSPCESEISGGDGSGTSQAPSPASSSPVTSRGSSASPKRALTKAKGSLQGRSKPSVVMRRIKREEETMKKVAPVEVPTPTRRALPRRANRNPALYVNGPSYCATSPLLSDSEPDTDDEWKPDNSMTSDHEDDNSILDIDFNYDNLKSTRLIHNGVPLIPPPTTAAVAVSGQTERQRIRSFVKQREIRNPTSSSSSAEWVHHRSQFLCKAIVRQASKKGRAKWLPGCGPEVGKPCNQLLGTYQDWERHFSCSQWHQEPDTCRFCSKSLNVRSAERHLGNYIALLCLSAAVSLTPFVQVRARTSGANLFLNFASSILVVMAAFHGSILGVHILHELSDRSKPKPNAKSTMPGRRLLTASSECS
jgi:hypothetical protein